MFLFFYICFDIFDFLLFIYFLWINIYELLPVLFLAKVELFVSFRSDKQIYEFIMLGDASWATCAH